MKKVLAVLIGLSCLVSFPGVSMAASEKNVKKPATTPSEKNLKGLRVPVKVQQPKPNAKEKGSVKSSEHSSIRGGINGGGDFI